MNTESEVEQIVQAVEDLSKVPAFERGLLAACQVDEKLVKVPANPSVHLLVSDKTGTISLLGGENHPMPVLLATYAARDNASMAPEDRWVIKKDAICPLGQDIYVVTHEFLMFSRAALVSETKEEIRKLDKTFPSGTTFELVVSL